MDMDRDEFFMQAALQEAKRGFARGEVPVGAVLVYAGEIIARAHNLVEETQDPSQHAEMLCIKEGSRVLGNWRLLECTLYCTLEPCPMCAGAMIHGRLARLVWGAPDLRCGAGGSWVNLFDGSHPIHCVEVQRGVLAEESAGLMRDFFKIRRDKCLKPCLTS
ncbi:MAG: nucleoside deaminase [Verrucomicrobia bacterium]|nr:nucleoside deaminase [Verrucomicrobiota bacterium]